MSDLKLRAGRPSDSRKAARLADLADKPVTSRVNFDMERDKVVQLKVVCAQSGVTIADVCRKLLDEYLRKHSKL